MIHIPRVIRRPVTASVLAKACARYSTPTHEAVACTENRHGKPVTYFIMRDRATQPPEHLRIQP